MFQNAGFYDNYNNKFIRVIEIWIIFKTLFIKNDIMYNCIMWRNTIGFSLRMVFADRVEASQMRSQLPGRLDSGISAFHAMHILATLLFGELTPLFLSGKNCICMSFCITFIFLSYLCKRYNSLKSLII